MCMMTYQNNSHRIRHKKTMITGRVSIPSPPLFFFTLSDPHVHYIYVAPVGETVVHVFGS